MDQEVLAKIALRLTAALYSCPKRSLKSFMKKMDRDHSGQLEQEDFRKAIRVALKIPCNDMTDQQISMFFSILDSNNSGGVEVSELEDFLKQYQSRLREMKLLKYMEKRGFQAGEETVERMRSLGAARKPLNALDQDRQGAFTELRRRIYNASMAIGPKRVHELVAPMATGPTFRAVDFLRVIREVLKIDPADATDEVIIALFPKGRRAVTAKDITSRLFADGMDQKPGRRTSVSGFDGKFQKRDSIDLETLEKVRCRVKAAAYMAGKVDVTSIFIKANEEAGGLIDEAEFMSIVRGDLKLSEEVPDEHLALLFRSVPSTGTVFGEDLVEFLHLEGRPEASRNSVCRFGRKRSSAAKIRFSARSADDGDVSCVSSDSNDVMQSTALKRTPKGSERKGPFTDAQQAADIDLDLFAASLEPGAIFGSSLGTSICRGRRMMDFKCWEEEKIDAKGEPEVEAEAETKAEAEAEAEAEPEPEESHEHKPAETQESTPVTIHEEVKQAFGNQAEELDDLASNRSTSSASGAHAAKDCKPNTEGLRAVLIPGFSVMPFVEKDPAFLRFSRIVAEAAGGMQMIELEGAREYYRRVVDRCPTRYAAVVNLACCEAMLGEPSRAADLLSRAVRQMPEKACAHVNLVLCLLQVPDHARAVAAVEAAFEEAKDLSEEQSALLFRCKASVHLRVQEWTQAADAVVSAVGVAGMVRPDCRASEVAGYIESAGPSSTARRAGTQSSEGSIGLLRLGTMDARVQKAGLEPNVERSHGAARIDGNTDECGMAAIGNRVLRLKESPLFANANEQHLEQLAAIAHESELRLGDEVICAGSTVDSWYLVTQGSFRVYLPSEPCEGEFEHDPGTPTQSCFENTWEAILDGVDMPLFAPLTPKPPPQKPHNVAPRARRLVPPTQHEVPSARGPQRPCNTPRKPGTPRRGVPWEQTPRAGPTRSWRGQPPSAELNIGGLFRGQAFGFGAVVHTNGERAYASRVAVRSDSCSAQVLIISRHLFSTLPDHVAKAVLAAFETLEDPVRPPVDAIVEARARYKAWGVDKRRALAHTMTRVS